MFSSIKNKFALALLKKRRCLACQSTVLNPYGPKSTMIYVKWDGQRTRLIKSCIATSKKLQSLILSSISWSDITADFGSSRRLD